MSDASAPRPIGRQRRAREREPRRAQIQVKVTESEREELRARAAELGVSMPRLMVESALSGVQTPTDRRRELAELFELRRLLATVANNVNQLAKAAHVSGQVAEQSRLEQTLADVDATLARLRQITGTRR